MEEFKIGKAPMISGQGEIQKRIFKKIEGKKGIWYIAKQKNPADNIYVTSKNKDGYSDGFAGATLSFELEDGTIDKVQGPWHSNSASLFNDTGYDIINKHLTFGVIAKNFKRDKDNPYGIITDIIYKDDDWVVGPFNRIKQKAQEIANELGERVIYYQKSQGGSIRSWCDPEL